LSDRIVILTGGIGCGKSEAARYFNALGIETVDADDLAHGLTGPGGEALSAIQQAFGDEFIDSAQGLRRDLMRQRVFSDASAKARLEGILHPMIQTKAREILARAKSDYVVYVVPLWFEKAPHAIKPWKVVSLDCPEETQIQRVMARSRLRREDVLAIMGQQVSRSTRTLGADHVIQNEGSLSALQDAIRALHHELIRS
jgi:dephospho-CoA kinase